MLSAFLVSAAFWSAPAVAQTTAALQDTSCAGTREGADINCTAGEFTVDAVVEESSGTLPTCTIGGTAEIDISLHLIGSNTDRMDAGLFIGQTGNDPRVDDAAGLCSVATFPETPAPFEDNDGDACGDFDGGGDAFVEVTGIKVACQFGTDPGNPDTYGKLLLPYTLTYWQNNGDVCTGPDVVRSGNSAKCNSGVGSVSGVTLTGYVDITKQTVPDGDPQVFNFTASNTVPLVDPTDAAFTLTDGNTHRVEALVDVTTQTITVTEALEPGWNSTATISCVDYLGQPVGAWVTTNGATRTITAALDIAHPAVSCTITNVKGVPLTINKTWVNGIVGNVATLNTTGAANNVVNFISTVDAGSETDTATPVVVTTGEVITITEAITTGSPANYTSALSCTGTAAPVNNTITVGPGDTAINCTWTNTRNSATLTLAKTWTNAEVGDAVTVSADGINDDSLPSTADTASETDTDASPITVFAGEAVTLTELFTTGLPGAYNSSLACTGTTGLAGNTSGSVLTVGGADTAITCTFTNARTPINFTLRKSWQNAAVGEAVTVQTTGAINNATLNSTAGTPTEIDAAAPVTVFAGEQITIGEVFAVPANAANYTSSLSCTGTTGLSGAVLTVAPGDTDIVCTQLNARNSASLTLAKTWVNASVGSQITATGTGAINTPNLASTAGAANETDTGTPVTVFVGEQITLSETFVTPDGANYSQSLACSGNNSALAGNVLTVNAADTAITCTFTNARGAGTLTLAKTWVNARVGESVTVNGAGGSSPASLASTAGAANETDVGSSVPVLAGEVITITETFGVPANAANYTSGLACTGLGNGTTLVGNVLTIGPSPGAIVCTETNTRRQATLTPAKAWVNAIVGNAVNVTTSGAVNNIAFPSTADTASETDTGSSVTVFAGESITFAEAFTNGSSGNYSSALACSGNGTPLAGSVLTVGAADSAITCTYTNTRIATTLTLRKTWVNATVNDAVTVSGTGGANPATLASVANTANETDTGTAVNVLVGDAITITEAFTTGSAANYTSTLACTGNTTPLVGNVLTVTAGDGPIVCTETNSRILRPLLNVTKTASPTTFIVGQPASYTVTVTNGGEAATSANITLADPLPSGITLVTATGTNWTCSGTTTLSCTFTGTLAVGASTSVTFNVAVAASATNGNNTATASGGGDATCPAAGHCVGTVLVPIQQAGPSLAIVKSANPVYVNAGSLVLYTLQVTNIVNYDVIDAEVRDMPPNGLAYVPGSGTIYDSNAANNSVSGARPIMFHGVDVEVGQTIRIQYLLRAGAALAAGSYTNYAQAFQDGQPISNIADFTVYAQTGRDPLLEQTRILGKVFDDQDGDGWQDPGERGVPGVRIASVEGLVSETDAHGRFHQEGIVLLNQERGKNYILKLDTATLPPGSSVTTENPLLRRVTAAIPARFDFGVKLPPQPTAAAESVDMALGEINFTPGSVEIRPEYQGVLDEMAGKIRSHQSGEVFIDSATGNSPLAFERAGRVREQLIARMTPEEQAAFTVTVRLQASDGTTGEMGVSDEVKLGEVFFDTDKSTIRPEFEPLLDSIARSIEAVGSGRVSIVGHADLRASTEYNQALGMRRANSVFEAIAKRLSPEARTKLSVEVEGAATAPGAGQ